MKHPLSSAVLLSAVLLFASAVLPPALSAAAQDTIGIVRSLEGQATVTRGEQVFPAAVGTKLQVDDTLMTGSNGSMGVILRDNSTLSIGPGSSLVVRSFLFSPAEGKLGLLVRLSRGTMAYLSGLIGKLAPESALFETPVASIGIRGTRFAVKLDD
jgi:hypothetical protein